MLRECHHANTLMQSYSYHYCFHPKVISYQCYVTAPTSRTDAQGSLRRDAQGFTAPAV